MAEPVWLSREIIGAMHAELIQEHGGSLGVRDEGLLDSALARPQNKWTYGETELPVLAAAYCFGLAKNHGFIDGNKRIALMAAYVFLYVNGLELAAPEPEAYTEVHGVATGARTEEQLANWIRERTRPL